MSPPELVRDLRDALLRNDLAESERLAGELAELRKPTSRAPIAALKSLLAGAATEPGDTYPTHVRSPLGSGAA